MTDTAAPLLKEIFNDERLRLIAREAAAVCPRFDSKAFLRHAGKDLDGLGIMQRMRQVATSLHATLPGGFAANVDILRELAPRLDHSFAAIALSEYVALYGQEHFELSMQALADLTRYGSSEFAVRPFIALDTARSLAIMRGWAKDDNEHVRRLASEGCRPRLPWSFQLKDLVVNPEPVAPILDALNRDPSLYVRKSVANHLNDISKDHPGWVIGKLRNWPLDDPRTAWVAKRALRTLIKNGDPQALELIGAGEAARVTIHGFAVTPASVALGERITIAARVTSTAKGPQRLVADYAIHYVKKKGGTSRKVFKLKEFDLGPGAACELAISQTIRDFTTRTHHPGRHRVELMVNGKVLAEAAFELDCTA